MKQSVANLQELLSPVIEDMGYVFWGYEYLRQGRHSLLRVYIDHENGITLDDCQRVSDQVNALLDVEEPISGQYNLEISSPGIERPLFKPSQFAQYVGSKVQLRTSAPIDGRRNFSGVMQRVDEQSISILIDNSEFVVPIDAIDKANLVS